MAIFTDGIRTAKITITNDNGVNWENDFYEVGGLTNANAELEMADILTRNGYDDTTPVYEVDDVEYLIDYANDMAKGIGDFTTPTDDDIFVNFLHR